MTRLSLVTSLTEVPSKLEREPHFSMVRSDVRRLKLREQAIREHVALEKCVRKSMNEKEDRYVCCDIFARAPAPTFVTCSYYHRFTSNTIVCDLGCRLIERFAAASISLCVYLPPFVVVTIGCKKRTTHYL